MGMYPLVYHPGPRIVQDVAQFWPLRFTTGRRPRTPNVVVYAGSSAYLRWPETVGYLAIRGRGWRDSSSILLPEEDPPSCPP